jgi:phospholipid/cholesterol/gamma-HCH transport system substrate-binding protein
VRGRGSSVASNPVLIGAATLLVVLVAVFLSYNANNGLPFVPTYQLKAELPSGANLVRGNEVRIGGARVGAVSDIKVKTLPSGRNLAVVTMKLDRAVQPLPNDSAVLVRPKSVLGLKYIEITRGRSEQGFRDGDTIPVANQRPAQVEFDEVADMFDEQTRNALVTTTTGFGDALAGRGESLNQAIGAFKPLLANVIPVLRTLRDPDTRLVRFIKALGSTASILAPAAEQQASLFVNADRTFAALAEVAPSIKESIAEGPATLDQAVRSFRFQRPFLANTEGLMRELRPGVRSLKSAAPTLADALRIGTPVLERSVALDKRLLKVLQSLRSFAEDPLVPQGVNDLTDTVQALKPTLDFVAPAQTQCNYAVDWFRNVSDLLTEGDSEGNWQRFIIIALPAGPNNEGGPASAPANGPSPNYLHVNPYPNTAAPGQPKECEAANEPYLKGQKVIGNVAGTQSASTDGKP